MSKTVLLRRDYDLVKEIDSQVVTMQSDKSNNRSLNKVFTVRRIGGDI